jgi:hypothetical protein
MIGNNTGTKHKKVRIIIPEELRGRLVVSVKKLND